MRKGRFAGISDASTAIGPLGPIGLIAFDLRTADPEDSPIAWERAGTLAASLPILAFSHLLWSLLLVHAAGMSAGLLLPLAGVLLLDLGLWLYARRMSPPHFLIRIAATYVVLGGALWAAAATAAMAGPGSDSMLARIALIAGVGASIPGLFPIPILLILAAAATLGVLPWIDSTEPLAAPGAVLACLFAWIGLVRAGHLISNARRQLASERSGQRAQLFLADFEASGRGWFWETNADSILTHVSDEMARHVGTPACELIGGRFDEMFEVGGEEGQRPLGSHLNARFPFDDAIVRAATDGDEHWWCLSGRPVFDDYGRFLGFRGMATNYSAEQRSEAERTRLARYDSLTGLPNRAMMAATLDQALLNAEARRRGCALMLIDLDKFKQVNDTLGHPVGDKLLKKVAMRLAQTLGDEGQPGRLGGDEFQAILPGIEEHGRLSQLAGELIEALSRPYEIEGNRIVIGASVGITVARPGKALASALVKEADLALYAAKAAGRGTFRFFASEMNAETVARQILEADLREAMARGQLYLLYQPIVDSVSEDALAFEALLRWRHPTRGVLAPAAFLHIAEESGLMPRIGDWVLRTACGEAANWPSHIRIAVNMSAGQLRDSGLPASLTATLASTGLDPDRVELEVGESVLEEGAQEARVAERLKAIGVRLTLDNYGAGRAGLGNLRTAPLDKIKIDRSFIRGASDPRSRSAAVVRAVVVLAESLGMDTTAQGAETREEVTLIRRLGCSQIQGFFFSKPISAAAAATLAAESRAAPEPVPGFSRPPRHRLIRNGRLEADGRSFPVRLRTISEGGATLECDQILAPELRVTLDVEEAGRLDAEVRWCSAGRVGLRFEAPFQLGKLALKAPRAPKMLTPDYLESDAVVAEPIEGQTPAKARGRTGFR
ncbi:MAG: diguanylate cyclase [Alphaproteobacteria bacterium]|nr:diguanylate cyclase [Alphaproteobacteria bacterium]